MNSARTKIKVKKTHRRKIVPRIHEFKSTNRNSDIKCTKNAGIVNMKP